MKWRPKWPREDSRGSTHKEPPMKKTARKDVEREVPLALALGEVVRRELREFVVTAGMTALAALLETERTDVCGPRYAHQPERRARRAGHAQGELVLGGRRVGVRRPRARTLDGHEVALPSWTAFAADDPLHERALTQMLSGVSTRRYQCSLEGVPDGVAARGTSKRGVSRRF